MGDAKAASSALALRLRIDGIDHGGFRECSGLDTSQDPIEYRALSSGPQPAIRDAHIVLRAGIVVDDPLLSTWQAGLADAKPIPERSGKDLALVLVDPVGREVRRWRLRNARLVSWAGPQLGATGRQAEVDAIELVCREVELA